MVGTPNLHAGPAKKRNHMVMKTRKAESVALASGSILSPSEAVAFEFGPSRSSTVFIAYEEVTRGMRGGHLCVNRHKLAMHSAERCCSASSIPAANMLCHVDADGLVLDRIYSCGSLHHMPRSACKPRSSAHPLPVGAGDSGSLSSPAATLVPAIPLLLVAARLTAEMVALAANDADSDAAMDVQGAEGGYDGAMEGFEEPQGLPQGPTATVATVDGCALPAATQASLHSASMALLVGFLFMHVHEAQADAKMRGSMRVCYAPVARGGPGSGTRPCCIQVATISS